jgi:hypothetical protein
MNKSYRHLLDQDYWPLLKQPTGDAEWQAVQFSSYGGDEAVVFVFSGYEPAGQTPEVRLKGLDADARYRVCGLFTAEPAGEDLCGSDLMNTPLALDLPPRSFAAYRVEAC